MKNKVRVLSICIFFFILTACVSENRRSDVKADAESIRQLAIHMLQDRIVQEGISDYCFSPLDAYTAGRQSKSAKNPDAVQSYSSSWGLQRLFSGYTVEGEFHMDDGQTVKLDYIKQEIVSETKYLYEEDYTSVGLSLSDGGWVYFIIPNEEKRLENIDVSDALRILSIDLQNAIPCHVTVPTIQFDAKVLLPKTEMTGDIVIPSHEQSIHFCMNEFGINTNERGTGQYYGQLYTEYTEVIVDRPFLYAILDADGIVRYIGIFSNN